MPLANRTLYISGYVARRVVVRSGGVCCRMRVNVATIPKNQAKRPDYCPITRTRKFSSGPPSGKTPDYPDKLAQYYALIRKNTRFPGQVCSTLGSHPEKHTISRTGWLNTMHSSGKTHDFPDKLAHHYALIRKNTRFPGQVGSILCTHPEKRTISRTAGYVRVVRIITRFP